MSVTLLENLLCEIFVAFFIVSFLGIFFKQNGCLFLHLCLFLKKSILKIGKMAYNRYAFFCMLHIKIHAKKAFFCFCILCAFFFCILKLKIHIKKAIMQKKVKDFFFKFVKYICKKKVENNISKKRCKKSRNAKKAGGVCKKRHQLFFSKQILSIFIKILFKI